PGVAGVDLDRHLLAVPGDRPHGDVAQAAVGPQQPRRLVEDPAIETVAGVEEQPLGDRLLPGVGVEAVDEVGARQPFARVVLVEDVADDDVDLADGGAGALELGIRRQRRQRLMAGGEQEQEWSDHAAVEVARRRILRAGVCWCGLLAMARLARCLVLAPTWMSASARSLAAALLLAAAAGAVAPAWAAPA